MSEIQTRRGYLDWVRGLAVLVMMEAHVLDSWTRIDVRGTPAFAWAMIVAGFGAPLFLFLAGVSVGLSAGSKSRRTGDVPAAAAAIMKRGTWIFLLAVLFRIQAWILGWGPPRTLLKVDILNIMGPSIVAAGAIWGACRSRISRSIAFAVAATAVALVAPLVQFTPVFDRLPNAFEAYLRPPFGYTHFSIFPWTAFVFAGACIGVLLDAARTPDAESQLNKWLAGAGLVLAASAYAASFLPSPYAHSEFWGASPAFFALRAGLLTATIAFAYCWGHVIIGSSWSPMQQLGRSSLFIYWIHVELVYGLISLPIHRALTPAQAWTAYVAFVLLMVVLSIQKDRFVTWWKTRGRRQNAYLIESNTF
ncbi:MAG TPA: heparan-alpha-glucosaminide N-acetyltransferase domain-containing protein [Vicinamibacterales bacterium]|nr:heparan-alpha-glucosaminide N-acetyltransferase domain-containing protein [Vicinamibacterales bacterium]